MQIPKSFNDLTVRQFQEATQIIKDEPDLLERHIKLIACLTGNTVEWVEAHTPKQIGEMAKAMDFLSEPKIEKRIVRWFVLKNKIFKPILKAESLTAGQVLSLKTFEEKSQGTSKYLHEQLAIIFTPVNWYGKAKAYDASKHSEIAEIMLDAKLGEVYGTLFFYSNVLKRLSPVIETYLKEANQTITEVMPEVMKWARKNPEILKENGLKVS
jgi:hypothetical protein